MTNQSFQRTPLIRSLARGLLHRPVTSARPFRGAGFAGEMNIEELKDAGEVIGYLLIMIIFMALALAITIGIPAAAIVWIIETLKA